MTSELLVLQRIPHKPLFTVAETADIFEVSVRTIYRWIEEGKLQAFFLGEKIIKIPREAIIKKFLDSMTYVPPVLDF